MHARHCAEERRVQARLGKSPWASLDRQEILQGPCCQWLCLLTAPGTRPAGLLLACLQVPLPAWSPALSPAWPPWNWGSGQCHGDVALGRSSRCSCPQKEDAIPFSTLAWVWWSIWVQNALAIAVRMGSLPPAGHSARCSLSCPSSRCSSTGLSRPCPALQQMPARWHAGI